MREQLILSLLIFQSVALVVIMVFCTLVVVYGYPLVGMVQKDPLGGVRALVEGEGALLHGRIIEGVGLLLKGGLVKFEPLLGLDIERLNEAVRKVNGAL